MSPGLIDEGRMLCFVFRFRLKSVESKEKQGLWRYLGSDSKRYPFLWYGGEISLRLNNASRREYKLPEYCRCLTWVSCSDHCGVPNAINVEHKFQCVDFRNACFEVKIKRAFESRRIYSMEDTFRFSQPKDSCRFLRMKGTIGMSSSCQHLWKTG